MRCLCLSFSTNALYPVGSSVIGPLPQTGHLPRTSLGVISSRRPRTNKFYARTSVQNPDNLRHSMRLPGYSFFLSFGVHHLNQSLNVAEAIRERLASLMVTIDLGDMIGHQHAVIANFFIDTNRP